MLQKLKQIKLILYVIFLLHKKGKELYSLTTLHWLHLYSDSLVVVDSRWHCMTNFHIDCYDLLTSQTYIKQLKTSAKFMFFQFVLCVNFRFVVVCHWNNKAIGSDQMVLLKYAKLSLYMTELYLITSRYLYAALLKTICLTTKIIVFSKVTITEKFWM